jgi:hypothetical protein
VAGAGRVRYVVSKYICISTVPPTLYCNSTVHHVPLSTGKSEYIQDVSTRSTMCIADLDLWVGMYYYSVPRSPKAGTVPGS